MILKNSKLRNNLKKILKENDNIEDILVFGSVAREKQKPNDIDILVLFKNKILKELEYNVKKELQKYYKNVSIISKTKKTIIDSAFDARESMLFEAKSLIFGNNLAEQYGFSSLGMFKYNFKNWNKLQKTKFYHALNGRKGKGGVAKSLQCIKIADNLILTPLESIDEFKEFMEFWNLEYVYSPILIPKRMNKKKILEQ